MVFSEPFTAFALAFAVLIDLSVNRNRRQRMAANLSAWWNKLQTTPLTQLMSYAAAGFYGFPAIVPVGRWARVRYIFIAFVAVGVIGTGFLIAGALLLVPHPQTTINHALNFLAAPSAAAALAWLAVSAWLLSRITCVRSVPVQAVLLLLLVAGAILTWVALMHMGTWLEWQYKRTPTAFGTEWFYAEVYMEYVREPAGALISLTAALIVALPVAPCILQIFFSAACKCCGPVLSPLLNCLIVARRGVLGLLAVLVVLLADVLSA